MKTQENRLSHEEIKAILRAADPIIGQGGRTLLAKILKGSREKKVLQFGLDQCPVYGYYKSEKIDDIAQKINWMIDYDFLDIEYDGKLPMIVYTDRGWEVECDQYADELLHEWKGWIRQGKKNPDMTYLKDRNRGMILLLLEKIKESRDPAFIPFLELWEEVDYKKVRAEIRNTINSLVSNREIDEQAVQERTDSINQALEGDEPQDFLLKCWECGTRFTFTVGEQQFYKEKGLSQPKRCGDCRDKRKGYFI